MKGQPKGLIAAALANMGERFGFYIMMAILTLFISAKFGLNETTAGYIYSGFYASIYLLALVGGIIADIALYQFYDFAVTAIHQSLAFLPMVSVFPFMYRTAGVLLIISMVIGAIGSTISLKRYMKV